MKNPEKTNGDAGKAKTNRTKRAGRKSTNGRKNKKSESLIAIFTADHRSIEGLFDEFKKADEARKVEIARQIAGDLGTALLAEEELLLPETKEPEVPFDLLAEAAVDHDIARVLTADIVKAGPQDRFFEARMSVLAKHMRRHFRDEEKASGIFGKAKGLGLDLEALGKRFQEDKEEFRRQAETETRNPMLRTLRLSGSIAQPDKPEEFEMARQTEMPGRDDRGRFMSDDDDDDRGRGGRSSRERGYSSRSRRDDDDDNGRGRGRGGWFGDPEGHSEAARERGSSRRRDDDDDDDRRYSRSSRSSSRSMRDDDDNGRGRGRGGWFGDSEGHSEASRRGWDSPDHGPSGWYGDSRGHSEASRRGWDNPDRGESGWFGDSEGHSEASRRGWEERGGSRSRGSRYDDDDDRSYRSRSRYDDDDDRRSGGGRGRGQGGWFGDSEGHSEASRRGWDRRR